MSSKLLRFFLLLSFLIISSCLSFLNVSDDEWHDNIVNYLVKDYIETYKKTERFAKIEKILNKDPLCFAKEANFLYLKYLLYDIKPQKLKEIYIRTHKMEFYGISEDDYKKIFSVYDSGLTQEKVLKYLKKAYKSGHMGALNEQSCYYLEKLYYNKQKESSYQKLAWGVAHNDINSFYNIGYLFLSSDYQQTSINYCLKYWKKAAKANHERALHNLGVFYYEIDDSIEENKKIAFKYWEKAACLGNVHSAYLFMNHLLKNEFDSRNKKMMEYCKNYYDLTFMKSNILVKARLFHNNKKEKITALVKEILSENHLDNEILDYNLLYQKAYHYQYGLYIKPNYDRALAIYNKILKEKGDLALKVINKTFYIKYLAWFQMGYMYHKGLGVKKDKERAKYYFSEAIRYYERVIKK